MFLKALGRLARPLILAGAVSFPACDNPVGPPPLSADAKDLAEARRTWAAQGLLSYRFRFQRICFCGPDATAPLTVVVSRDRVISVTRADTGAPSPPPSPCP